MQRLGEGLREFKTEHLTVNPHEVMPEDYLGTLSEVDKQHVLDLSQAIQDSIGQLDEGISVGMIVFGSSVRPENLRNHETGDIDIRLVSSAESGSVLQKETIDSLVSITGVFAKSFKEKGGSSEFHESTSHGIYGETIWLDYDNNDPSYEISPPDGEGLPLHISISGVGSEVLELHLKEEKKQKQYISLLQTFQGTKPA